MRLSFRSTRQVGNVGGLYGITGRWGGRGRSEGEGVMAFIFSEGDYSYI